MSEVKTVFPGTSVAATDPRALAQAEPAPPCTLVIFGGSGDLTKRLLMPALYNLSRGKLLPDAFRIIAVDRAERSEEDYRHDLTATIESFVGKGGEFSASSIDEGAWGFIRDRLAYRVGDIDSPKTFELLAKDLEGQSAIFYLALAARFFGPVSERLADAGAMAQSAGVFRRLVIEKPFGRDLESARALNAQILAKIDERQVYRIDHFLGKETVQNIMALRFGNGILEPLWHRDHVDFVEITAAETIGVEGRGHFYEGTGALRDMVPNHLCQLLALTAMEPPTSFEADAVRLEKTKVLKAIKPLDAAHVARDVVRGQYAAAHVGDTALAAYRAEPNVAPDSTTETFVALRLKIDNWRWAGVPFYVRTGKRLAARRTEIAVHFKQAPYALFRDTPVDKLTPNTLVLHIQPSEGATLDLAAKIPGPHMKLGRVSMAFRYSDWFDLPSGTGYETLLYDVMTGDPSLFQRADTLEAGWAAVQPILDEWARGHSDLRFYDAGSDGPQAAHDLLERDGRHWCPLDPVSSK